MKMTQEQFDLLTACFYAQNKMALFESLERLEKLLVESDSPTAKDDGWIEHDGNFLPKNHITDFNKYTRIEYQFPSASQVYANYFYEISDWRQIKRYRIVKDDTQIRLPTYNPETHYLVPLEWNDDDRKRFISLLSTRGYIDALEKVFRSK